MSKTRPFFVKNYIEDIHSSPLVIAAILEIYEKIVFTTEEELIVIKNLITNNINNYPDPTWRTRYSHLKIYDNDHYKSASIITKQHYLDIVFRILVQRNLDLELNKLIGNIFD
ncbi:27680_t:CDS:1, partial [Dentiscutata erythropus]